MLFLWTITKRGKIWIDGDAFRQIIASRLPADFYCQEVSFVGDQSLLNIYLTLPDQSDPQKRMTLTDKFVEFFRPSGINVHIHWTRKAPDEYSSAVAMWKKPLFWAASAGGIAGLANLGIRGIAWVSGAALLGYVISWIILSEDGNKLITKLVTDIKNIRR
ncbi:MAG: hypothetical protein LBS53_01165 [Synergistaceae bacterium]|jgi:hypothetical protein|nr:hypothetical protein [Synergistaceae bacterium]